MKSLEEKSRAEGWKLVCESLERIDEARKKTIIKIFEEEVLQAEREFGVSNAKIMWYIWNHLNKKPVESAAKKIVERLEERVEFYAQKGREQYGYKAPPAWVIKDVIAEYLSKKMIESKDVHF